MALFFIAYKKTVHKLTLLGLCLFPTYRPYNRPSRSNDASFSKFTCLSFPQSCTNSFIGCFYLADAVAMTTKLFAKADLNYLIFQISSSELF